ncbi:MAG: zinc metallopeptidase [Lachnospiraceae bacterium]|nr:zinc metallopeptidase [Lachnospiraceae bacterium]
MFYYYWDPTYILVLIGVLICGAASMIVNSTMNKYRRVGNSRGITGGEAARRILDSEGLYQVKVECLRSGQGDHYDPRTNTVRLSYENFNEATVTAVGVAAHECGHAIQHAKQYVPLTVRSAIVPAANICSNLGFPIIILGVILSWNQLLIQIGLIAFSVGVVFQLVTLPVEFNASTRAVAKVDQYGLLTSEEKNGCKKVLTAAAFTYVAAALSMILQFLRLLILFGGNRRRSD